MSVDTSGTIDVSTEDQLEAFAQDVLAGLASTPRSIPSRWLYDARGSELFERICERPEYYLTRTELGILDRSLPEIAERLGSGRVVFEPGAGAGTKTRRLMAYLDQPAGYVPVEISPAALAAAVESIRTAFPRLPVHPVRADFTTVRELPEELTGRATLVFFPGSTIGNFTPREAVGLLASFARFAGPDGALLLGFDRRKSPSVLLPAYDDPAGVTAEFDRNLLRRINRELGGDFDPTAFAHRAVWDDVRSRIEMRLESLRSQTVSVRGRSFELAEGDWIRTEISCKYTLASFRAITRAAGLRVVKTFTDDRRRFAVQLLEVARS